MDLTAPGFLRVRKAAYVARSLHTKLYRCRGQQITVFVAENPRAFRRAFVEASVAQRCFVAVDASGAGFYYNGKLLARCTKEGRLAEHEAGIYSAVNPSPSQLATMAEYAFSDFLDLVHRRYAQIIGLPDEEAAKVWFDDTLTGFGVGQYKISNDLHDCAPTGLTYAYGAGGYGYSRKRVLRYLIASKMKEFSSHLDQDGLRTLRRSQLCGHLPSVRAVMGEGPAAMRWRQALAAYPAALAVALRYKRPMSESEMPWSLRSSEDETMFEDFREVIEQGKPLAGELGRVFGLDAARMRRLLGVMPQRMGSCWRLEDMLPCMRALPLHLWPWSRADYRALEKLQRSLGTTSLATRVDKVLIGLKGSLGTDRRLDALAHIRDVEASLIEYVWEIFNHDREATERVVDSLADLHLGRLVSLVDQWHRAHREATQEATARLDSQRQRIEALTWSGAMPERVMQFEDVQATELTSPMQLLAEGSELGHCVGSYYPQCLNGHSRIVALSSDGGRERSTLELRITRGEKPRLAVWQHYSFGNTSVSASHAKARNALLRAIRKAGNLEWFSDEGEAALALYRQLEEVNRQIMAQHMRKVFIRMLPVLRQEIEVSPAMRAARAA